MHRMMPMIASRRVSTAISVRKGDDSSSISTNERPIPPSLVRAPVPVTRMSPCPRTIRVPAYTCPSPGNLSTASDSPVSMDSSAASSWACSTAPSAATRSPSVRIRMSSRTTSRPANRTGAPSRIASARGLERSRRACRDFSVRRSCRMVMVMMMATKPSRTTASRASPMAR